MMHQYMKQEYIIRKYQRAIGVTQRTSYHAHQGGDEQKRKDILEYAYKITESKKELFKLTGRCSPRQERWPI